MIIKIGISRQRWLRKFFKVGLKAQEMSEGSEGDVLKMWRKIYYG
jgi:hypothetical protein